MATLVILVVVIILLFKLFSGRADLTSSHACVLQMSSTMTKNLHIFVAIVNTNISEHDLNYNTSLAEMSGESVDQVICLADLFRV